MEENDNNIKVVLEDLVTTVEKEENKETEEIEADNLDANNKSKKAKKVKKPITINLGTATLLLVSVILAVIFITIAFGMITIRKIKKNDLSQNKKIIYSSKSIIVPIEKEM